MKSVTLMELEDFVRLFGRVQGFVLVRTHKSQQSRLFESIYFVKYFDHGNE